MSFIVARTELFKLEGMTGSYLHLLKPRTQVTKDGPKIEYEGTFLWAKKGQPTAKWPVGSLMGKWQNGTEFDVVKEAARLAKEAWKDAAEGLIQNEVLKTPFLDGDGPQAVNGKTGQRHEGYAGHYFIRTTAGKDFPPKVIDSKFGNDNRPVLITDIRRVYPGAKYHVVCNLLAWAHPTGGKGIKLGLDAVQFAADGERIGKGGGGGADPSAFFSGVKDAGKTAESPSGDAGGLFS